MTINKDYIQKLQGGKEHLTWPGLLDFAHSRPDGGPKLKSIEVDVLQFPSEQNNWTAVCRAMATMEDGTTYTDIGDANNDNSPNKIIAKHSIRLASTRAKGRALRDAVNIGDVLMEEMGVDGPILSQRVVTAMQDPARKDKIKSFIKEKHGPIDKIGELQNVAPSILEAALALK